MVTKTEPNISIPFGLEQVMARDTIAIVLAGGQGRGLFPLTRDRAVSAVPIAGKYRLIDIPLSNCLNSGIVQVFVLTQFNSGSTNRHISNAYAMDHFASGFVEVLAAQQTMQDADWYQGTADAVRQNLSEFSRVRRKYYLILSGDHLYRMDYRAMLEQHLRRHSRITIATTLVDRSSASRFGIVQTNEAGMISRIVEKPREDALLRDLATASGANDTHSEKFEASMGIYLFDHDTLEEALALGGTDFARHILPSCIERFGVSNHRFDGYWRDLGHLDSFYSAHLELCEVLPAFDFFDAKGPMYTIQGFMPGSKVNAGSIRHSLLADGCILSGAAIYNSVLGPRTIVREGTVVHDSIVMGADYYDGAANVPEGCPTPGIGRNCKIDRAIIDKNACIADNVRITSKLGMPDMNSSEGLYYVRDGLTIIPKGVMVPEGSTI